MVALALLLACSSAQKASTEEGPEAVDGEEGAGEGADGSSDTAGGEVTDSGGGEGGDGSGADGAGTDGAGGEGSGADGAGADGAGSDGSGGGAGGGGEGGADPCLALAPDSDPAVNRAAIQACLDAGEAVLSGGVYDIDSTLFLDHARLDGLAMGARITMVGRPNSLLTMQDEAEATGLILDAGQVLDDTNGAVVHFTGSNSTLSDSRVGNLAGHTAGHNIAGVYFISPSSSGNLVSGVEISDTFYGVIFVAGLTSAQVNRVEGSVIHTTACDGVTFAGYGELVDSTLYQHGWDCENGPIPGASVYGLNNNEGALISDNHMFDDCGNVVDLDAVQGFTIEGNTIEGAGYDWEGWAPWCGGVSLVLIDSSYNYVGGNVISNNDRPQNAVGESGDPNDIYDGSGSNYSDLPSGSAQTIAFVLAQRPASGGATVNNLIEDNELRSSCSGGCTGLGWFVSRGAGTDASGGWSASTTNYFLRNTPYGSEVGSQRCGASWYAANDACGTTWPSADCNQDDYQHDDDWLRNDAGCRDY